MARILYIAPEHVTGMLSLFQQGHRARGHECRFVTLFPASSDFEEDICLRLPLMSDSKLVRWVKSRIYKDTPEMQGQADREGYPPEWRTSTAAEAVFFFSRDLFLSPKISHAIRQYRLDQYDLYHLDQGLDFFRNAKFIRRMKARGAKVICFYNGTDLRNRGVIPEVDAISDLNLTSELDLVQKHPNIKYLHLPFDVERFESKGSENDPLIIGHTCRGPQARHFKGTDHVIKVVQELEKTHGVTFDLVEGVPHEEALRRKATWDIAVDQIADAGGWGYGVNSLESLSQGIPTCTRMRPECDEFFKDHPFINVDFDNLKEKLVELIDDPEYRRRKGEEGRTWVYETHRLDAVMDQLYKYYAEAGIII
jgi:glycosyltransferase involved in cell wall biosynthesis